jgi:hypothetical protein
VALSLTEVLGGLALTFAINNRKCRVASFCITSRIIAGNHIGAALFTRVPAGLVLISVAAACSVGSLIRVVSEGCATLHTFRHSALKFTVKAVRVGWAIVANVVTTVVLVIRAVSQGNAGRHAGDHGCTYELVRGARTLVVDDLERVVASLRIRCVVMARVRVRRAAVAVHVRRFVLMVLAIAPVAARVMQRERASTTVASTATTIPTILVARIAITSRRIARCPAIAVIVVVIESPVGFADRAAAIAITALPATRTASAGVAPIITVVLVLIPVARTESSRRIIERVRTRARSTSIIPSAPGTILATSLARVVSIVVVPSAAVDQIVAPAARLELRPSPAVALVGSLGV